jgi:hypothetical protein
MQSWLIKHSSLDRFKKGITFLGNPTLPIDLGEIAELQMQRDALRRI